MHLLRLHLMSPPMSGSFLEVHWRSPLCRIGCIFGSSFCLGHLCFSGRCSVNSLKTLRRLLLRRRFRFELLPPSRLASLSDRHRYARSQSFEPTVSLEKALLSLRAPLLATLGSFSLQATIFAA